MSKRVFVIAEAGVNHNGSADMAFQLIDAAIEAGADAVKFQTFKADKIVTRSAAKANYQESTTSADETQYEMLKRLELSEEVHFELVDYCKTKNIHFMSTAFDEGSLRFLVDKIGISLLKVPSGEITNAPLLLAHAESGCKLILSSGMATIGEIEDALGVLAFGYLGKKTPGRNAFKEAYFSMEGQQVINDKVTLLHCTSEYPAPYDEINLNVLSTYRKTFGLKVGYSDHSEGSAIPIAAVALGATIVEKHFTLDCSLPGPDHKASMEPNDLKEMIESIRAVEQAMGSGIKIPTSSEKGNRLVVRKSIVAKRAIDKNETFTHENLAVKRPGTGVSPMEYWKILGRKSECNYEPDDLIE